MFWWWWICSCEIVFWFVKLLSLLIIGCAFALSWVLITFESSWRNSCCGWTEGGDFLCCWYPVGPIWLANVGDDIGLYWNCWGGKIILELSSVTTIFDPCGEIILIGIFSSFIIVGSGRWLWFDTTFSGSSFLGNFFSLVLMDFLCSGG